MPASILVVDDDDAVCRGLALALRAEGFLVDAVSSGEEALDHVQRALPDLVLLDSALPDVSGTAVVERLRRARLTELLPIIMVTGRSDVADRVAGLAAGADDYVVKPFAVEELMARVHAQIRGGNAWRRSADGHRRRAELARDLVSSATHDPAGSAMGMAMVLSRLDGVVSAEILHIQPGGTALGLAAAADGLPLPARTDVSLADVDGGDVRQALAAGGGIVPCRLAAVPGGEDSTELVVAPLGVPEPHAMVLLRAPRSRPAHQGESFGTDLLLALRELSPVVDAILTPELAVAAHTARVRSAVFDVIRDQRFRPVFQPIVHLASGAVAGYEALTRFDDGCRPDLRFAEAWGCGVGVELECAAVERALLVGAERLPAEVYVSINVSPSTLSEPVFFALMNRPWRRRLVIEITEHERIDDYDGISAALGAFDGDVRLAVDDAGSGYASLRHVLELGADIVKLDRGWVSGIDGDPARQALVLGITQFVSRVGGEVVAEGIETAAELAALKDLGVPYGQGYFLGGPSDEPAAGVVGTP